MFNFSFHVSAEFHERLSKIDKLKNRYEILTVVMLPPEGEEEKTQAYYVIKVSLMDIRASLVAQMVNYPSAMQETRLQSLG